jgi:hypothetical protein
MVGDKDEVVEEYEVMWQLASLAGVLLEKYTPKVGCDCQLAQSATKTLVFWHLSTTCNTLKR